MYATRPPRTASGHTVALPASGKPRNPFALAARARRAGVHRKSESARRREAQRRLAAELSR